MPASVASGNHHLMGSGEDEWPLLHCSTSPTRFMNLKLARKHMALRTKSAFPRPVRARRGYRAGSQAAVPGHGGTSARAVEAFPSVGAHKAKIDRVCSPRRGMYSAFTRSASSHPAPILLSLGTTTYRHGTLDPHSSANLPRGRRRLVKLPWLWKTDRATRAGGEQAHQDSAGAELSNNPE